MNESFVTFKVVDIGHSDEIFQLIFQLAHFVLHAQNWTLNAERSAAHILLDHVLAEMAPGPVK